MLWERILWSNVQFIKSLFLTYQWFRYRDNMQISWNFRENYQILVAVFKAPVEKPKQIFISRARRTFRHLTSIKWARFDSGHITIKSFWNYTQTLAFHWLLSNLHQRMCFSQWQLQSATDKQTNIEYQNLLLLIFVSNSRRYSLNY